MVGSVVYYHHHSRPPPTTPLALLLRLLLLRIWKNQPLFRIRLRITTKMVPIHQTIRNDKNPTSLIDTNTRPKKNSTERNTHRVPNNEYPSEKQPQNLNESSQIQPIFSIRSTPFLFLHHQNYQNHQDHFSTYQNPTQPIPNPNPCHKPFRRGRTGVHV